MLPDNDLPVGLLVLLPDDRGAIARFDFVFPLDHGGAVMVMGLANRHASAHRTNANTDAGFIRISSRNGQRETRSGSQCNCQFHVSHPPDAARCTNPDGDLPVPATKYGD